MCCRELKETYEPKRIAKVDRRKLDRLPSAYELAERATAALKPMQRVERPRGLDEFCKMLSTLVPPSNNPIIGISGLPKTGKTTLLVSLLEHNYAPHAFLLDGNTEAVAIMSQLKQVDFEYAPTGSNWQLKSKGLTQVVPRTSQATPRSTSWPPNVRISSAGQPS
jgi:hypothetical protein